MTPELPPSPGTTGPTQRTDPAQLDPELATIAFARELVRALGTPSDVTKVLVVRKGVFKSLHHIPPTYGIQRDHNGNIVYGEDHKPMIVMTNPGNPTGYDCSPRLTLYDAVERGSVNIDGKYFNAIMTFLSKPKIVIQGLPAGGNFETDKEPGFISRIIGRLTGKGATSEAPK